MATRHTLWQYVHGTVPFLRRISVALAALCMLFLAAPLSTAYAQGGNQIIGTVYDTTTSAVIPHILVAAYTSVDDIANNTPPVAKTTTDDAGTYTLADLPNGSYLVQFNALLDQANYNANYYEQYYNGVSYIRSDQPPAVALVPVSGGQAATGINAHLKPLIATTTRLSSTVNPAAIGQTITIAARVTPNTASGMMIFADNGQLIPGCGFTFFSNGVATCTVALATAGSHTITAHYEGDADYKPSDAPTLTQSVTNSPYTYDQCLHGGWRNFAQPHFHGQAQCLLYVFWHNLK